MTITMAPASKRVTFCNNHGIFSEQSGRHLDRAIACFNEERIPPAKTNQPKTLRTIEKKLRTGKREFMLNLLCFCDF